MAEHALRVAVKGLKLALIVACIVKGKSNYVFRCCLLRAFEEQDMTSYSACVWDSLTQLKM